MPDDEQVGLFGDGPPAGSDAYRRIQTGADFGVNPVAPAGYHRDRDHKRLTGQLGRVYEVMADGEWHSINDIRATIGSRFVVHDSPTGISARLRDLRKWQFGGFTVERRHVISGIHEYRLKEKDD